MPIALRRVRTAESRAFSDGHERQLVVVFAQCSQTQNDEHDDEHVDDHPAARVERARARHCLRRTQGPLLGALRRRRHLSREEKKEK